MKITTKQNLWWALAVVCLFGGFLMVSQHDTIDNIPLSNAVSAIGYVIGLAGTVGAVYKAWTYSPKGKA